MTVWFYPIDWNSTIAAGSALVAAGALGWNVWWSRRVAEAEANKRLAEMKQVRLCGVTSMASEFIALVNRHMVQRKSVDNLPSPEETESFLKLLNTLCIELDSRVSEERMVVEFLNKIDIHAPLVETNSQLKNFKSAVVAFAQFERDEIAKLTGAS